MNYVALLKQLVSLSVHETDVWAIFRDPSEIYIPIAKSGEPSHFCWGQGQGGSLKHKNHVPSETLSWDITIVPIMSNFVNTILSNDILVYFKSDMSLTKGYLEEWIVKNFLSSQSN